jgi:hypothetical protein
MEASPLDEPTDTEVPPMTAEDRLHPEYARITAAGRQEAARRQAEAEAEAQRQRASAPPPPTTEQKAENMAKLAGATFLSGAAGPLFGIRDDLPSFKLYLDNFMQEAGASGDPLERLLLEQVLLGHHATGRLHFRAGTSQNLEEVTACLAAVARLMAECRRTTLALQTYRDASAAGKARSSKVKPRRQAGSADANGHGEDGVATSSNTEVGSKNRLNGYLNGTCHAPEPALT